MIYNASKRLLDIFFSLMVLVIISPLLILVSLILKFTGENKVIFKQKRIGKDRKEIVIYKFVSMLENSENIGTKDLSLKDDPRVLPFGKFIRKYKINELPQFFNVLIGTMTLVGPRPLMKRGFDAYDSNSQKIIALMKPGITGIGSICFRNEDEIIFNSEMEPRDAYENLVLPHKAKLEKWYTDNQSFALDLILILFTGLVIFFPLEDKLRNLYPSIPRYLERN